MKDVLVVDDESGLVKGLRLTSLLLVLILALAAVGAGCGLAKKPAPSGELPVPSNPGGTAPARTVTAAVFFADWQAQHVIPEARQIPEAEGAALATQVVKELLAGPADPNLHRTLPADVKLVQPVSIQNGVAYVDLSKELENLRGAAGVAMGMQSLRLSLTEIPGISKVQVLVEGRKDVLLDEGLMLGPMDRGFYGDYPVLPDPQRAEYLQERADKGIETWRADPAKVVRWDGRMFGFTAEELNSAKATPQGTKAQAFVLRGGKGYTIELTQQEGAKTTGIWTITGITEGEQRTVVR